MSGKRISLLLKSEDMYLEHLWIKRTNDGSILGWFVPNYLTQKHFPPDTEFFGVHFHFPARGKYHYAYKYKVGKAIYHVRAYKDELNVKVLGDIQEIYPNTISLPEFQKLVEMYMISGLDIKLQDANISRQIFGIGFNIWIGRFTEEFKKYCKKLTPQKNDIVLDVDEVGKASISCMGFISNIDGGYSASFPNAIFPAEEGFIRTSENSKKPVIELVVQVMDNPNIDAYGNSVTKQLET
jgi:hypothetical protein